MNSLVDTANKISTDVISDCIKDEDVKTDKPKTYRVVTFQSKEVVDILLSHKDYYADKNLMREGNLCEEDISTCNGNVPVWVFQHPAFKNTDIGPKQWCHMLQEFRCEMSVDSLDGFYMIELLLPKQPPMGKAHNGSSLACIIPHIKLFEVSAIYKVTETDHWYFYDIEPIYRCGKDILFTHKHTFRELEYERDESRVIRLIDYKSSQDYYI